MALPYLYFNPCCYISCLFIFLSEKIDIFIVIMKTDGICYCNKINIYIYIYNILYILFLMYNNVYTCF